MFTDNDRLFHITNIQRVSPGHCHTVSHTLASRQYLLVFVASGKIEVCLNGNSAKLSRGGFVLCHGGDDLNYRSIKNADTDFFLLFFENNFSDFPFNKIHGFNTCSDMDNAISGMHLLWEEFVLKKPHYDILLSSLCVNLLCILSRSADEEKPYQKVICEIAKEINENFISGNIDIEKYAARLCISKDRLSVIFREHFGYAPYKYQLMLKMKEATNLLERTDMSVGEISDYLGFSNPLYFSSAYKKQMGISPTKKRKK